MSRLRTPLIILGLVGAVVVAVAVVLVIRLSQGTPVELPVAIDDIQPGTPLDPNLFRLEEVEGLTPDTLSKYVTKDEFLSTYSGYPVIETIRAGFPVAKAQVLMSDTLRYQDRLTILLEDPGNLVYPLDVAPGQAGNYIAAGDYVDIVFTLGRVSANEIEHVEEVEPPPDEEGSASPVTPTVTPTIRTETYEVGYVTTTMRLPLSKVILPNVHVLRVEREQVRVSSGSYAGGAAEARQTIVQGDVVRLYLELTPDQAEILSFAMHNGILNLPARARPAEFEDTYTDGYIWDDFVDGFFQDRSEEELKGER